MPQPFVRFQLDRTVPWHLQPEDPIEVALAPLPGWVLLTPIASVGRIATKRNQMEVTRKDGSWYVQCDELCFRDVAGARRGPGQEMSALMEQLPAFLARLRFLAKQPAFARRALTAAGWDAPDTANVERRKMPAWDKSQAWSTARYLLNAVTLKHLHDLSKGAPLGDSVPVFADIFLDAIDAHIMHDFRRAILYAAIATETMVRTVLDERLAAKKHTPDPVFKRLKESREFKVQLHESSLYVLGGSLLVAAPTTYESALCLSRTRNVIVHAGELRADTLTLDRVGSATALATAKSVFDWYGVDHDYPTDGSLASVDPDHPLAKLMSFGLP